jgi:hypothetical protein
VLFGNAYKPVKLSKGIARLHRITWENYSDTPHQA